MFRAIRIAFCAACFASWSTSFASAQDFPSVLAAASKEFAKGYAFRDTGSGQKFEILKQVSNDPAGATPRLSFAQILANYKKDDQARRMDYFRGAVLLFDRLATDFVPQPGGPAPGITPTEHQALMELLHSSEAEPEPMPDPDPAPEKAKKFRWLSDAELMLASDNLLNALDSRFQVKTNDLNKSEAGNTAGSEQGDEEDRPEPPSASDAFTYAADEAGLGLSTYWIIRQDVGLLDRDAQPVDGVVPLSLESLYMQLQERRLQSRINGAKVRFNESSRGKLSKDDIQKERDAAEDELQQTGVEAYLSLAILGASHESSTMFSENGAGELRTKLGVAARVHSMIRSGKQPDGYIESFIPNRNPVELYADAVSATTTAIEKENIAKASRAEQLGALTQISAEIDKQRQSFRYPLEQLSGFRFQATQVEHAGKPLVFQPGPPPVLLNPTLAEHREAFFRIVDERIESELKRHADEVSRRTRSVTESIHRETDLNETRRELANQQSASGSSDLPIQSFGALGAGAISIQQATTAVYQSYQALQHALDAINDEKNYVLELDGINQEALRQSREVLTDWAQEQKELAARQVFLSSTSASVSYGTTGFSASISTNPFQGELADNRRQDVANSLQRDLELESIRSTTAQRERAAGLKKTLNALWREFDAQLLRLGQALLDLEQARNDFGLKRASLASLVEDWASARDLAGQSFEAYADQCVQRESSRLDADEALRDAVKACYLASKAFQYVWVERYSNPVTVMGTGTDVVLPRRYFRQFTNPESILGARDANELRNFLEALYEWHKALSSGLRGSPRGNEVRFTKMISLRKQILGFDENVIRPTDVASAPDQIRERRVERVREFRDWLKRRQFEVDGQPASLAFEFATEIDSDAMFSRDEWNQKIQRIGVNFLGDRLPAAAPTVSLTQSGIVSVRRFPPAFQNIERYSLSGYGLNEFDDLFTRPAEQRTYDKIATVKIEAARRDFLENPERTMSSALVDMSVAADRWAFLMNFRDPSNRTPDGKPFPVENLDDVEFIFMYSFNHPNDELATQIRLQWERLSGVIRR